MRRTMCRLTLAIVLISLTGCRLFTEQAPNVVMVKPIVWVTVTIDGVEKRIPSDAIVIGPGEFKVYVKTESGLVLSNNKVSLEGWLAAPPRPKKEKKQ